MTVDLDTLSHILSKLNLDFSEVSEKRDTSMQVVENAAIQLFSIDGVHVA